MTLDMPTGIGGAFAFVFGACVGSFVCMVAYRLPRDLSIITPRSYCESCERAIPWWANIPILAYLGLRGRCVMCGAPIPFRHFLAELRTGTHRALSLLRISTARRDRALRAVRRAVDRRDHRLRLAADSEHHHLARHARGIHRRVDDDARGRLEKFAHRNPRGRRRPVGHRLFLPAGARARGRRPGRRVAARNGGRISRLAGSFLHDVFRFGNRRNRRNRLRTHRRRFELRPVRSAIPRPIRRKRTSRF